MKPSEIYQIIDEISNIKLDGEFAPKAINEVEELNNYSNFDSIIRAIEDQKLQMNIPNHKLHDFYDLLVPKNSIRINNLFIYLPYLIAIGMSIYGIVVGNYWLLITIPLVFISAYLALIFGGGIFYFILLGISIYFVSIRSFTLGFSAVIILITIFFMHYLRIHRRNSLLKSALSDERIFCFMFYSKTLTLYDRKQKKLIYSGMRK